MEESDKEMNKIIGDDEVLKKVAKNIEKLNENKSIVVWYDAEKEAEKIRKTQLKSAENEGIRKGINQRNTEIAKNLKNKGVDISIIADSTGLSIQEIEKL